MKYELRLSKPQRAPSDPKIMLTPLLMSIPPVYANSNPHLSSSHAIFLLSYFPEISIPSLGLLQPGMVDDLLDVVSLAHLAVEHATDQVDALLAHDVRDAEVAVHDLVDAVEGVLLVYDGV